MLATLAIGRSHRRLLKYIALGFLLRYEENVFSVARSVSTTCVLCTKMRGKQKKAEMSEKKLVGSVSELIVYYNLMYFKTVTVPMCSLNAFTAMRFCSNGCESLFYGVPRWR